MATCITNQIVSGQPRVRLTVTEQSSNATSITYAWELHYIAGSSTTSSGDKTYVLYLDSDAIYEGSFVIKGLSGTHLMVNGAHTIERATYSKNVIFSFTMNWNMYWNYERITSQTASLEMIIPARESYTITYNANGGVGEPSAQTKLAGVDSNLSSIIPTRTGYTFLGWSTSQTATTATYLAGSVFTDSSDTTLYAVWAIKTYTVTYNANGGTGAPSNQIKTYGVDLTLSDETPTKTNCTFIGWGTSVNSLTASYQSGAVYSTDASVTLYAIWSLTYEPPYVMSLVVDRCKSDGTLADNGTYLSASFKWKTDVAVSSMAVTWSETEKFDTTWTSTIPHSGTELSGTKSGIIFGDGAIDIEKVYHVRVYVTDELNGSSYYEAIVPSMKFTMDFLAGGKGVAFGKVATQENTIDTDWELHVYGQNSSFIDVGVNYINGATANISEVLSDNIETNNFTASNVWFGDFAAGYKVVADEINLCGNLIRNGLCAYESSPGIDPDTTLEHEILTSNKTPNGAFMYIVTYFYSSKETTSNRMQTAFPYNKAEGPYYRYYLNGTWSKWMRIGSHIHATTEQVTGNTWTDGKPIYRRVISGSLSTLNADTVVGTISNMAAVVDFRGTVKRTSGGSTFGMTYYASSSDYHRFWVKSTGEVTGRSSTALTVNAIVDYTKTTD